MIFFVYYIAAMVLVAAEMRGLLRARPLQTPQHPALYWCGLLIATYGAQVAISLHLAKTGPWPFGVVPWRPDATLEVIVMLLTAAIQSYALLGLLRTRVSMPIVVASAIVLLATSLAAPVLTNGDLYAYVGDALLGKAAYTPPHVAFNGDLAAINVWWGTPVPPATYGPLWIAVAGLVTTAVSSLAAKMLALRAFGALLLGILVLLLRAYGVPARVLVLVALNPALYFQFVLNAHNDLFAADITVAAGILAASRPLLAPVLIAAAALVKAPFVVLGLPVLARIRSSGLRFSAVALSILIALVLSWFAGGLPYLQALEEHLSTSHLQNEVHFIAGVAALCMLVAAIAGMRRLRSVVWLLPMLGAYTTSWYALWSLPYAIGARRVLIYFLIWLPFVMMLSEPAFWRLWTLALVLPAAVILALQAPRKRIVVRGS